MPHKLLSINITLAEVSSKIDPSVYLHDNAKKGN